MRERQRIPAGGRNELAIWCHDGTVCIEVYTQGDQLSSWAHLQPDDALLVAEQLTYWVRVMHPNHPGLGPNPKPDMFNLAQGEELPE